MRKISLSIDVDFTDYLNNESRDEMGLYFRHFQKIFVDFNAIKATWFVRIDADTEREYGSKEYFAEHYQAQWEWLKEQGHEIGFHFHSSDNNRIQNRNEELILEELESSLEAAVKYNFKGSRMGWTWQHPKAMKWLSEGGYIYDSSAFPRPVYPWENRINDWSTTPSAPYFPSDQDIRIPGTPAIEILEIPISTVEIAASSDTRIVKRYINPAYRHTVFKKAIMDCPLEHVVLVMHPYEAFENRQEHSLIAFDDHEFRRNIEWLSDQNYAFHTLLHLAEMEIAALKNKTI